MFQFNLISLQFSWSETDFDSAQIKDVIPFNDRKHSMFADSSANYDLAHGMQAWCGDCTSWPRLPPPHAHKGSTIDDYAYYQCLHTGLGHGSAWFLPPYTSLTPTAPRAANTLTAPVSLPATPNTWAISSNPRLAPRSDPCRPTCSVCLTDPSPPCGARSADRAKLRQIDRSADRRTPHPREACTTPTEAIGSVAWVQVG